jgi:hypothetical protein
MDSPGSILSRIIKCFYFLLRPDLNWNPTSLLPKGYEDLSSGMKGVGSEIDHSPLSRVDVKMVELYRHVLIRLHGSVFN